jgi:kynureninase
MASTTLKSKATFDTTAEGAKTLDAHDPLHRFRSEFIIPTLADLKRPTLSKPADEEASPECIYLCGNSLGLQPRRAAKYIDVYLRQWSTKAVTGHFVDHSDSPLAPFLHIDDTAAKLMAPVVGALESEVAVMGTLTANLHFMMASFYLPTKEKWKIIFEGKAFPSDHYAIESQIVQNGFDPKEGMIMIEPEGSEAILTTEQIRRTIDKHASDTALILLPGIQFYTGQYFDIPTITEYAHAKGILIGWDCAHAVGNVDLKLHDWDVDFAVWCNYKYVNSGPGAMAGIFVHEKHGKVDMTAKEPFRPRLSGWWGDDKATRFQMKNGELIETLFAFHLLTLNLEFVPRPGAAGFQLSNPSALDMSAVVASLELFNETSMHDLRQKSLSLTAYLEQLLDKTLTTLPKEKTFTTITPREPEARGAQLSIRLKPGLLDSVLAHLEHDGVIVDERKPDVIRVAPTPLYNTYTEVWRFIEIFKESLLNADTSSNTHDSTGMEPQVS